MCGVLFFCVLVGSLKESEKGKMLPDVFDTWRGKMLSPARWELVGYVMATRGKLN